MIALETTEGQSWNSLVALKKRVGRLSYSVICLYPVAEKIAPVFDDLACPYRNRVRFPSPAPFISSANSQFFQALSYECPTKPPGSAPFHWVFSPGIETVVQGQVTPLTAWRFPGSPAGKSWCPRVLSGRGCRVEAVSQIHQVLLDWDANSAVASSACLDLEASVIGWPRVKTI